MKTETNPRLLRAMLSLDGLSVGDAFGQLLSTCSRSVRKILDQGQLPAAYWWHTDDTRMAMAIVAPIQRTTES